METGPAESIRPASGLGLLVKRPAPTEPETVPSPAPSSQAAPVSSSRAPVVRSAAHRGEPRQGYPATIHHRGPGRRQASVRLPGPILRHLIDNVGMRFDRPERGGDALVTASDDVQPGDRVLLRVRDGQLAVAETLSADSFARETNRQARAFLGRESQPFTHIDEIRAARLRLEAWLGLSRDDRNPWAIPGELKDGALLLSRRVLLWCQSRSGSHEDPQNWLQRGFPRPEDWGPGPMSFCARLEDHDPRPRFRSLVISAAEHQVQIDAWRRLLDTDARVSGADGAGRDLAAPLLGLMRRLELAPPRTALPESQAVLSAWSAAGSAALARRSMAMFLLERVETETQRAALRGLGIADRQIEALYERWREAGRPVAALQGIVEPDEIEAALEALAQSPGAQQISAGLLLRWKKQIASTAVEASTAQAQQTQRQRQQALTDLESIRRQSTELQRRRAQEVAALDQKLRGLKDQIASVAPLLAASRTERPALPVRPATRETVRAELASRGLPLPAPVVDRLLLATMASAPAGALTLLSDPSGRAPDALADLFEAGDGAVVSVRAGWSGEADLLGRVSPDGLRFVPSPFTEAARRASAHALTGAARGAPAPFFLHLRDADRADPRRYAAGLIAALDGDRRLELYPRSLNARWLAELEQMKTRRAQDSNRFAELQQAFSAEALGGSDPKDAWRLQLPPHTIVLATLHHRPAAPLTEHGFFVALPPPALDDVLAQPADGGRHRLQLPARSDAPLDYDETRAAVEDGLRTLLPLLPPPAPRLGRQLVSLISEAARWEIPDGPELAAHLLALTALPRLRDGDPAPLAQLASRDWIPAAFAAELDKHRK